MELFFLAMLVLVMAAALGSGYPVAFALPGSAIGSIALGASTAWVIIWIGFNGKQSIINSPIMNFEITQTGGAGMFVKYQMAAFLGIFAITMLIQFIGYFFEAWADYRDEPGH